MYKIMCLLISMLVAAVPALAGNDVTKLPSIVGFYMVEGTNPGGAGTYFGKVVIQQTGAVYKLNWNVGGESYIGTGILTEDVLSVVYSDSTGNLFGVVAYQISRKGDMLVGRWTVYNGVNLGSEIMKKEKGERLNPDGQAMHSAYEL